MKYLLLLALLFSCQPKRDNEPSIITHDERVKALFKKRDLYCDLGREYMRERDHNPTECDSLLFTSLWGYACGEVPIDDFMNPDGQWFRTTDHGCYPERSKSTISKDMFRGLLWYLMKYERLDLVNKTLDYGRQHNWIMGEAINETELLGRCVMTPAMVEDFQDLALKLEGETLVQSVDEEADLIENTGFLAHLDVLRVLFHGQLYGGISDGESDLLKNQAEREPNNALFGLARRLYDSSWDIENNLRLLENGDVFPVDHLPTSDNYCTSFLWERDEAPKDWAPCPDRNEKYSGIDFVFSISLLEYGYEFPNFGK